MNTYKNILIPVLVFVPFITHAATIQTLLSNVLQFISKSVIPFLFGLAFLFIVINVFRYFILKGADEEGQKKAKSLIVYGVAAFVFLATFFGIVNLLSKSTGLEGKSAPEADYMTRPGSGSLFESDPCDPTTYNADLCPGGA